ncbi:hypothetical protein [Paenibacillus physcomitrellae]|uniref:Polymer-forming cytoskeletal protein n=1 Tax=Paenibacillus physcomitrellae TaxID=1619311 RepID=A0ABQ1GHS0_9BACL|nr:hypothetical protein [Paenibacillus physcomitrellae]GGA43496.1 hypothetical protein GCM10010917_30990 [Paenibacillus physcomitrellae]
MMERSNINIIGEGSSSGGQYGKVKVVGEADFFGSMECEQFKITGEATVDGGLLAEEIKVTGTLQLKKKDAPQHGSAEADIFGHGTAEAAPGIRAETVKITGELTVPGSCEAEEFKLRGQINAGGVLSAEEIDIKLHGVSRVREIGGAHISVKAKTNIPFGDLLQLGMGSLQAALIEGDHIYLENTEAEHVRGIRVEIGPGCRIGSVEYRDSLEVDSRAEVHSQNRV